MHPKQLEEIEHLRRQSELISKGELIPEVVDRLKRHVPDLSDRLFLFDHVIDQGEDFFTVISCDEKVYRIEVPRRAGSEKLVGVMTSDAFSKDSLGEDDGERLQVLFANDGTVRIMTMPGYEDTGEIVEVTTFAEFARRKIWSKGANRRLDAIRFLLKRDSSRLT